MLETISSFLHDPNIVFLLFIVAMIGFYTEIAHPGIIVPAVIAALALVLFLFAAVALTPNWIGLIFMLAAFTLLILDLHLPANGIFTLIGIASLIFGTLLFFQNGDPQTGLQILPWLVYSMSGLVGGIALMLLFFILRVRRLPVTTGVESMVGAQAVVTTALRPIGRVRYGGENWEAALDQPDASLEEGAEVQIVAVDGLRLQVRPLYAQQQQQIFSNNDRPSSLHSHEA